MKPLFSAVKNAEPYMQKPFRRKEKEKNRKPRTVRVAKVSSQPTKISASMGGGEVCGGGEEKTGTGDDREALSENAPQFILTISMKTGYISYSEISCICTLFRNRRCTWKSNVAFTWIN